MRLPALNAGAVLIGLLAACNSLPRVGPAREASFTPAQPSVVAFTPEFDPVRDNRSRDDYAAAISSLRTVLGHLTDCAALPSGAVHLILADRVHVVSPGGSETIEGAGAPVVVLMDTGRAPKSIQLGTADGDGSVDVSAAAATYFGASACGPAPQPDP